MVPARLRQTGPVPPRAAWLLSAAVVLAHVLVLRGVAQHMQAPETLSTRVFSTRSIQIAPSPAVAPPTLPRRPVSKTPPPRAEPAAKRPERPRSEDVLASATRPPEPAAVPPPLPADPAPAETAMPEVPVPPGTPASPEAAGDVADAEPPAPRDAASAPAAQAPEPAVVASAPAAVEPPAPQASAPAAVMAEATRPLTIPGSVRLAFDAVGKRGRLDYKAMGDLVWLQDGDAYEMRMEMGDWIIGKRVLSSKGRLTAAGLAPTRFSDKFRSERAAHFDRQLGRIVFSANTPQAELLPGAQDQLSIFAQLAALVGGDVLAFPIGATVAIQTAGPRTAETWVFAVEREEMLYLPGGHVPALKLVRSPNKDYDQKVELWLAPELGFLPARIRITFANGDYLDQQWKSSSPP